VEKPKMLAKKKEVPAGATNTDLPLMDDKYIRARSQPKPFIEEKLLQKKYSDLPVEDKAFQILVDLGMIEPSSDDENASF
jgi:hypothetical protein